MRWLLRPLFLDQIVIWKCWFLWREENWEYLSGEKISEQLRTRTNNKLNPYMAIASGIQTQATLVGEELILSSLATALIIPHCWEASVLTMVPYL